jgi:hypothetical protein
MKMGNKITATAKATSPATTPTLGFRLGQWLQDPMGSVIAASAATIGAFGFVLSGTWFISLALN